MGTNFNMLNFCTEYSSKGNTEKPSAIELCFGTIFHSEGNGIEQENTYTIKLYKLGDFINKKRFNNALLMDKTGIIHHLKILQSVFKFSYHLKENEDHFELIITLKGDLIYHKYALSWIRYLYEYPFNVFLADAHKLKKVSNFRFESIINLFNLVGATSSISDHGTSIHAIGETSLFKELLTTKEIQNNLKELCGGHNRINNVFETLEQEAFETLHSDYTLLHNSDYWDSEEEFNKRLELYKKNYKILTNFKKK